MLKLGGWPRLTWGRGASLAGSLLGFSFSPRPRDAPSATMTRTTPTTRRGAPRGGPLASARRPRAAMLGTARAPAAGHPPRPRALPPSAQPAPRRRASYSSRGETRGATGGVTPRQACPRPEGLGRNLRSKIRWFAGFCNSHHVSHFATFFIDARAEISVAGSRVMSKTLSRERAGRCPSLALSFSLALAAPGGRCCARAGPPGGAGSRRPPPADTARRSNLDCSLVRPPAAAGYARRQ